MATKTDKVRWSNYSIETISTLHFNRKRIGKYEPGRLQYNSLADSAVLIKDFFLKHSAPLVQPTRKNKKCGKVFIKLLNYPLEGDIRETYRASRKEYWQKLAFFSTNVKLIKLLSSVMLQSQLKNYFGNLLKVSALHLK